MWQHCSKCENIGTNLEINKYASAKSQNKVWKIKVTNKLDQKMSVLCFAAVMTYFTASCAPGAQKNTKLCQLCRGDCSRSHKEPYYDYAGAFQSVSVFFSIPLFYFRFYLCTRMLQIRSQLSLQACHFLISFDAFPLWTLNTPNADAPADRSC